MTATRITASRRMLYAAAPITPSTTSWPVGAAISGRRALIRSIHQMNAATIAACGYSDSSWSVCSSSTGAVPTTATTAMATRRPARRRTMPWASTSHTQNAATSSSFSRS